MTHSDPGQLRYNGETHQDDDCSDWGGPAGLMAAETTMTTSNTNHNHDGKTSRQDIYIFYPPLDVQPLA